MLEPPEIAASRLAAAVARHYGLQRPSLSFLPLGHDLRAWAYLVVAADGTVRFLKVRRGRPAPAALRVPRYLADRGVPHIVAPLPARSGRLWAPVEGYTLALYPFVEGTTGGAHGMGAQHWITYGAALRAMHEAPLTAAIVRLTPRESFASPWPDAVRALDARLTGEPLTDPNEQGMAAFWLEHRGRIVQLVERLDRLGARLRAARPPLVLCHADIHYNNVMIGTDGGFWIVDWEDTLRAPKECDLMMGVGGLTSAVTGPQQQAWFLRGYGSTTVDPLALAYYRHLRAVGDIAANGEQMFLLPAAGAAVKADALERMRRLFVPGNIVTLAEQASADVC